MPEAKHVFIVPSSEMTGMSTARITKPLHREKEGNKIIHFY
jgi:hypothetical protein